ncbi:Serine/threonine-protein kinase brsk1 [Coelomomyces lativittatus]|nr:Serine/threonine-protein kinase brsk1 [Coelomomyces lativittatus]
MATIAENHEVGVYDGLKNAGCSPVCSSAASKAESIGPYTLKKTLGVGSTGYVKLGIHNDTKQKVAVKIIPKNNVCNGQPINLTKKLEREISIMKLMKHPNVMSLYETFETETEFYLVLEYVEGGELFEFLVQRGRLDEFEACQIFQKIIFGLDYCHKFQICHRDLKPENLLLDKEQNIKIADFGMASLQRKGKFLETSCGSPHYASPEIVRGTKYDGLLSDIWSSGVILFALLSGNLPFDDENIRRLLGKVKSGRYHMPSHLSDEAKDLVSRMLQVDPSHRIKMQEILDHPWFNLAPKGIEAQASIFRNSGKAEPVKEVDAEILKSMMSLGWSDKDHLVKALKSNKANHEKAFYRLYYEHQHGLVCQCNSEKVCELCLDRIEQGIVSPAKKENETHGYAFGLKFLPKRFFGSLVASTKTPKENTGHEVNAPIHQDSNVTQTDDVVPLPKTRPSSSSSTSTSQSKLRNVFSFFHKKRNGKTHPLKKKEGAFSTSLNGNSRSSTTMNNTEMNEAPPTPARPSSTESTSASSSSSSSSSSKSAQPSSPVAIQRTSGSSSRPSSSGSLTQKWEKFLNSFKSKPKHIKLYSPSNAFEILFSTRGRLLDEHLTIHENSDGSFRSVFEVEDMVKGGYLDEDQQKVAQPLIFKTIMYRKKDDLVLRLKLKQGSFEVLEQLVQRILEEGVCYLTPS